MLEKKCVDMEERTTGKREKGRKKKTKPSLSTLPIFNDNVSVQMHVEREGIEIVHVEDPWKRKKERC